MISPNVETVLGCDSSYRAADIVLYGAPYDSTKLHIGAFYLPAFLEEMLREVEEH